MSKLICLSLLFLLGCGSTPKEGFQNKDASKEFEILYQSPINGAPVKSYRVVRNIEDYRAFFISIKEDNIPEIDFKKANVLILNMGQKNTGGYNVAPEKMIDDGKKLIMILKETYPKKGDMVTMSLTSPVCIVKINSKKDIVIR